MAVVVAGGGGRHSVADMSNQTELGSINIINFFVRPA